MTKGTVLFIDDDSFLRKVYQAELHDKGFDVALAVDGEDGLRKIVETKPDCIILDLIMPKKNGFEVLADIKRSEGLRGIPVIILSNLAQSDDQKKAFDLGAVEYLVKDNTTLDIIAEKIEYYILLSKQNVSQKSPGGTPPTPLQVSEPLSEKREMKTNEVPPERPVNMKRPRPHNFCSECGAKLEKNDKFCSQCGTQQY